MLRRKKVLFCFDGVSVWSRVVDARSCVAGIFIYIKFTMPGGWLSIPFQFDFNIEDFSKRNFCVIDFNISIYRSLRWFKQQKFTEFYLKLEKFWINWNGEEMEF